MRQKSKTVICADCGGKFKSKATKVKYCPDCRQKRFRLKNLPETRICTYSPCGIEYETTRGWSKYCCSRHRIADYKRRMEEEMMKEGAV